MFYRLCFQSMKMTLKHSRGYFPIYEILHVPVRLHRLCICKGVYPMSFANSLLVALFLMAIVFTALFALYLFITLFSLIVETAEHASKHKKAAQ